MSLSRQRKIHQIENGDSLALPNRQGRVFILHEANVPAGGNVTKTGLAEFLDNNTCAPEHQALLKMIGDLTGILSSRSTMTGGLRPVSATNASWLPKQPSGNILVCSAIATKLQKSASWGLAIISQSIVDTAMNAGMPKANHSQKIR
jgi:hypothetical protein